MIKTFFFILILSLTASAQLKRFSVYLVVEGEDREAVESQIGRELRALHDVEVGPKGDLWLNVTALKLNTKAGVSFGYAMSYSLTEWSMCVSGPIQTFLRSGMLVTPDLRDGADKMVTQLDSQYFKARRRSVSFSSTSFATP